MSNENVEKLIEMIEEKAFVPGDYYGISEIKVVFLDDVLEIIKDLKD